MTLKRRFSPIAYSLLMLTAIFGLLSCGSKTPPAAPTPAAVKQQLPEAATPPDPNAAARPVLDVLASLTKFDQTGRNPAEKISFELPEGAINEYLAYSLRTRPRPGIDAVHVSLLPENQMAVEVKIDFDAIWKWNSSMPAALHSLFKGKQTMRLNLEFAVHDGRVTLMWKDARAPNGGAVLNGAVAGLLQVIGAHQPEGYDPTRPIPLPYGLKRIWTNKQVFGGET
jgi:hypothetical protein